MSSNFKWIKNGGVTSAMGLKASGVTAGIRANRADMALLLSDAESTCAALFTSNRVAAAPVVLSRKRVATGNCRGVIINSGCANACTGRQGFEDAVEMARLAADAVG
ncbi:MAG: bifunctional ornithine acetyltransferase/N-acetylglutamate synthase, partial [Lentisphaerae bacterium]|nr:bifunctional ornithine acetyltransferase/N-acetylglutamate synthase [Lentisphaerota bacterium]